MYKNLKDAVEILHTKEDICLTKASMYMADQSTIYAYYETKEVIEIPNTNHNKEIVDKEIIFNINKRYEEACILKSAMKEAISIVLALDLFIALTIPNPQFLLLIYNLLSFGPLFISIKIINILYDNAFVNKFILDNLNILNDSLTLEDKDKFAEKEMVVYENFKNKIEIGNMLFFDNSKKEFVKKIKEVKNGR